MRVLFCGGGTAGHVNPAIAVAETVMRNSSDNKVAYVATYNGIENQLVDFKKYQIDVIGLKKGILKAYSFAMKQARAIEDCKKIIKEFHPDIIFGTGGYATYPVITAGKKLGIKTVIHESNAIPGKAVLALQKKADKILVNFEESKKYFKCTEKVIRTGNPIRKGCEAYTKENARKELKIKEKYVILCTGGSLGAERINFTAIELLDNFVKHRDDIFFIWSTGKNGYDKALEMLEKKGLSRLKNVMIGAYFKDMPRLMASSDIVISRAGAMTISELASMKKTAILVPSPNVANDHQTVNAEALKDSGAAIVITEDRLYSLIDTVRELICDEAKMNQLGQRIGEYAISDANKAIYNILLNLI